MAKQNLCEDKKSVEGGKSASGKTSASGEKSASGRKSALKGVRLPVDLADLHVRWPQLRDHVAAIAQKPALCATERELINWMVKLGDRVGRRDFD